MTRINAGYDLTRGMAASGAVEHARNHHNNTENRCSAPNLFFVKNKYYSKKNRLI